MKKTLLCFLFLLFTHFFYAQVSGIEHCYGDTSFDLTSKNSLLLENLNPAETTITFHLSADDANNNINAIANPLNYSSSASSKTIYARIDNNGTITTNFFDIKIYEQLGVTPLTMPVRCKGMNDGRITVITSGGKAPYAYQINGSPYTVYNGGFNPLQLDNLSPGAYNIQAKDALGCLSAFYTVQITEPNVLSANITVENQNVIIVHATGGSEDYQYSLNGLDFQNSPVFTTVSPGNYTVNVRDTFGCIFQIPVVIYPQLTLAANTTTINCNNSTGTINAIAAGGKPSYTYSINGTNFSASNVFNGLAAGTYTVKVRDGQNAEASVVIVVPVAPPISYTYELRNVTCVGASDGSITIKVSGGQGQYLYSLNGGNFQLSNTFNGLSAGTYHAVIKDENNCLSAPFNFTIQEPNPITSTVVVNNQTITVNAAGGTGDYLYSLNFLNFQDSNIFQNVPKGTHEVYVKDSNGCIVSKSGINVNPLTVVATATTINCNMPAMITVTAEGGSGSYQYSFNNGQTFTNLNVYNTANPGMYNIIVKDSQNNTANAYVEVHQTPALVITAEKQNIRCKGDYTGVIKVNATGGQLPYKYSINGSVFSVPDTFNNLSAGTYNIIAKDAFGCDVMITVMITEPAMPLMANVIVQDQTIKIETQGGTGKIVYAISPNLAEFSTNNVFSNLSPGDYQVIAQDENGCLVMLYVTVDVPAPLFEGKEEVVLEFKSGQTLGDLVLNIPNVKWYSSPGSVSGKTRKSAETTLPLSTVLVDGVTYYASQTINGVESKKRLAITAKLNGSLSTDDFVLPNFRYFPNPVQHSLSLSNASNIDEVELISVSGKSIFAKQINNTHSEIDLSNISSGLYFLKVKAEGKIKTVKIVKK